LLFFLLLDLRQLDVRAEISFLSIEEVNMRLERFGILVGIIDTSFNIFLSQDLISPSWERRILPSDCWNQNSSCLLISLFLKIPSYCVVLYIMDVLVALKH
jgi:hypothetical protein